MAPATHSRPPHDRRARPRPAAGAGADAGVARSGAGQAAALPGRGDKRVPRRRPGFQRRDADRHAAARRVRRAPGGGDRRLCVARIAARPARFEPHRRRAVRSHRQAAARRGVPRRRCWSTRCSATGPAPSSPNSRCSTWRALSRSTTRAAPNASPGASSPRSSAAGATGESAGEQGPALLLPRRRAAPLPVFERVGRWWGLIRTYPSEDSARFCIERQTSGATLPVMRPPPTRPPAKAPTPTYPPFPETSPCPPSAEPTPTCRRPSRARAFAGALRRRFGFKPMEERG